MIGNTDYSPRVSPGDDNCCHNVKLYRGKDDFHAYAVPYDFDFSGLVNAPYAIPTPKAEIRNVRTRRYWGYCEHNEIVRNMVPHFMQVRESIEALVSSSELSKRSKGRASKYLKAFFETVSDPKKLEKRVLRDCR
jgi:hypothetical protein